MFRYVGIPQKTLQELATATVHPRTCFLSPLPRDMETAGGKVAPPLQGKSQVGLLA